MPGSNSSNERLIALATMAIGKITDRLPPSRITPELRALKPDEAFVTHSSPFELRINGVRKGSYITLTVELSDEDNILVRGVLTFANGATEVLRPDEPEVALPCDWQHLSDDRILVWIEDKIRRIIAADHLMGRGRHTHTGRQRERVAA